MSVQNLVPIHMVDVKILYRIKEKSDQLVALQEKSEDLQSQ